MKRIERVNGSQSKFSSKNRNWALNFNWDKENAQTKSTSANQWSHDFKMFLRFIWDQQNKQIANQTPKSKSAKTVSLTNADFRSSKFSFWIRNWTKRTLIELKFCTRLDKRYSNMFTKLELKWIYILITDLKTLTYLGFCWSFLKRTQNEIISDHNQKLYQ